MVSDKNGIFFINQETNGRIKVDNLDTVNNNPSELLIVIPSLEVGTYKLEVTTQFSSSGSNKHLLKEPRSIVFDRILTVLNNE
jgi:outer membrane lipoprotein-sorting protein